ncbi:MAG: hypothetical protein RSG50_09685, partial [Clostridia bacterium]
MNIHDVLHRSTSSGEVLCIYCDNANTNTFSAGIIQDSDEAFVLINHLTPDGDYDGYMLRRIDDIYLIESNNKYALSLCKMYAQKEKKHMMIGKDPGSIMERLLKYAKE